MPRISIEDFNALVAAELPFAVDLGMSLDRLGPGTVVGRLPYRENFLRPGGTIAGPMLVALADYAMYALTLSVVGRVPLAVTTNLNINFLHQFPAPAWASRCHRRRARHQRRQTAGGLRGYIAVGRGDEDRPRGRRHRHILDSAKTVD